jgi:multimeric flavodoxin WrbA
MPATRILAFQGSPRPSGNSTLLLKRFIKGASENGADTEIIDPYGIHLNPCAGCLRCNILKKCSVRDDDWLLLSEKILAADVLVFATPVYFHHLPAPLKMIIDRFRSFIHVQITGTGLIHTPWESWKKYFVLIQSMGSSDVSEGQPVIDLFRFMTTLLGPGNHLHQISATRLAMAGQVTRSVEELEKLYEKLKVPVQLAGPDFQRNQELLNECEILGHRLSVK